jgi:hypothetical protein
MCRSATATAPWAPSRHIPTPAAVTTWRRRSPRSTLGRIAASTTPAVRKTAPEANSGGSVATITRIAGNDDPQHSHSPTIATTTVGAADRDDITGAADTQTSTTDQRR